MTPIELGEFGFAIDIEPDNSHLDAAAEIEKLGFTALWIHGGQLDRLDRLADLAHATEHAVIASSIIAPDVYGAHAVLDFYRQMESEIPGRFLVGLGAPQKPRAIAALGDYLDQLDAAESPVPQSRRILGAIGPRKLDIARERFAGAVPILVTPAYAAAARERLGPDRALAVGQFAVLDDNPDSAREAARVPLRFLMTVRGYADSARRLGFTDADVNTLSDRLVDALVSWGSAAEIAAKAHEHHAAGADHVQLTVLHTGEGQPASLEAARLLAPLLVPTDR
jgi:probable F420-dependent oxidoreductase